MSDIGDAQRRALEDAEIKFLDARGKLDEAKGAAEELHEAAPQLLDDQTFWEAVGAINGMCEVLTELIEALGLDD